MTFTSFGLHPDLLRGVKELGFKRPNPVQADAIPPAIEGRDLLACAQTGSGKTAAFLLPILHRLIGHPPPITRVLVLPPTRQLAAPTLARRAGPPPRLTRVLVLPPTRELAAQILEDFNALAVHTSLTGAAVYGG